MDVITAHANGFANVVASSGTALTTEQIAMIKRYTENISLAFDMDKAGEMAADRGIHQAMKQEMNIKVIELPQGKDPDDCIRANPDDFKEAILHAKSMIDYFFNKTLSRLNLEDIPDRRIAVKQLLPIILKLGNKVEQDHWIRVLSQKVGVQEQIIRETIQNLSVRSKAESKSPVLEPTKLKEKLSQEEQTGELILALLIKYPALIRYSMDNLRIEEIKGQSNKAVYNNVLLYYNNQAGKSGLADDFLFNLNDFCSSTINQIEEKEKQEALGASINRVVLLSEREYYDIEFNQAKQELIKFFHILKRKYIKSRINEIEQLLSELEKVQESEGGNKQQIDSLMNDLLALSKEYQELSL